MCFRSLELVQLIQEYSDIKFSIVSSPDPLYGLVDQVLVTIMEEVRDFSGPVHGLDLDLDGFGFVGRNDVVHGANIAPRFDPDCFSRFDLHFCDVIVGGTNLVGVDCAHRVYGPSVLREFKDLFSGFCDLETAVVLDRL